MANYSDFNTCIFTGRLFNDPELKDTNSGLKVASFDLANNRRSKDEDKRPNSLRFVAFGSTAEFVERNFKKGQKVLIRSRVDTDTYEKDGVKRLSTRFIIDEITWAESRKDGDDFASSEPEDYNFLNVGEGSPATPFA